MNLDNFVSYNIELWDIVPGNKMIKYVKVFLYHLMNNRNINEISWESLFKCKDINNILEFDFDNYKTKMTCDGKILKSIQFAISIFISMINESEFCYDPLPLCESYVEITNCLKKQFVNCISNIINQIFSDVKKYVMIIKNKEQNSEEIFEKIKKNITMTTHILDMNKIINVKSIEIEVIENLSNVFHKENMDKKLFYDYIIRNELIIPNIMGMSNNIIKYYNNHISEYYNKRVNSCKLLSKIYIKKNERHKRKYLLRVIQQNNLMKTEAYLKIINFHNKNINNRINDIILY